MAADLLTQLSSMLFPDEVVPATTVEDEDDDKDVMLPPLTVSVVGDLFLDVLASGMVALPSTWGQDHACNRIALHPGGGALNTAVHLGSLNDPKTTMKVTLFAAVGDMSLERTAVEEHLRRNNVAMKFTMFPGTTIGMVMVLSGKSDRSFVSCNGATGMMSVKDLDWDEIARSKHLAVGGLFNLRALIRDEGLITLFDEVLTRAPKITISLDSNTDGSGVWGRPWLLDRALVRVHVFKANENEALHITGCDNVENAVKLLASKVKVCAIVTIGAGGCVFACREAPDQVNRVTAPKIDVQDTTGAGDAFTSGFLTRWLVDKNVTAACQFAVRCGSTKCTRIGGCSVPLVVHELVGSD